jgi:NSS family neurotransmitter:Na+ symporter
MVVYGSYLKPDEPLGANAVWTAIGDTGSGLLAGLAIIPAIIALGMEPSSGPALIFSTLPDVFATIPMGWFFGFLFFAGLFGAGYLSDVAAFEVLVAGVTDNTAISRKRAVWIMAGVVFLLAIPSIHQQRHLHSLGPHVRFRHADARRPHGRHHTRLVREPLRPH